MAAPTPFLADPDFTLYLGDVREVLPLLSAESVDCALTSPPFYALRDYGVQGQIGLEATPDEWVAELVAVFREVRRVLRPQGTLWVECGDSYASNPKGAGGGDKSSLSCGDRWQREASATGSGRTPAGYKTKDLIGAPWLLAFALRADGWYLRQCIIWQKPNAMPESVRDRCTTAHSYLFLLSKNPRYWFDAEAIAEPAEWARWGDQTVPKYGGTETASGWMQAQRREAVRPQMRRAAEIAEQAGLTPAHIEAIRRRGLIDGDQVIALRESGQWGNGGTDEETRRLSDEAKAALGSYYREFLTPGSKNARSVWQIPTEGYSEAHFATWPQALVERVLKAGCPEAVCGTCGKARERLTDVTYGKSPKHGAGSTVRKRIEDTDTNGWAGEQMPRLAKNTETVGWSDCGHNNYQAGVCLDPFMGSGTTALVARRLGRRAVGVELNADYCRMAARRLQQLSLLA